MNRIMFIAPHPDDETLGAGGLLQRKKLEGSETHWVIVTEMQTEFGYTNDQRLRRKLEIQKVAEHYKFNSVNQLKFPAGGLNSESLGSLIGALGEKIKEIKPDTLIVPFPGDAHTDHHLVFDSVVACSKWFRFPSVKKVLCSETLSETNFIMRPNQVQFNPNYFFEITNYIEKKIEIMKVYVGEMHSPPHPRSSESIRALATLRGAQVGSIAAEAFMLLKGVY